MRTFKDAQQFKTCGMVNLTDTSLVLIRKKHPGGRSLACAPGIRTDQDADHVYTVIPSRAHGGHERPRIHYVEHEYVNGGRKHPFTFPITCSRVVGVEHIPDHRPLIVHRRVMNAMSILGMPMRGVYAPYLNGSEHILVPGIGRARLIRKLICAGPDSR